MRSQCFSAAKAGAVALGILASACTNPRTEAGVAQALHDAASEINGLKMDIADLSARLDSLQQVVIKQDSTISRIAAVTNVPISR